MFDFFLRLNNSFLIEHKKDMKSNAEIDKNSNINDLEKIRKNNKLLELNAPHIDMTS